MDDQIPLELCFWEGEACCIVQQVIVLLGLVLLLADEEDIDVALHLRSE
jgi:hypothetical protein